MEAELLSTEATFMVGTSNSGFLLSSLVISRLQRKSLCQAPKNESYNAYSAGDENLWNTLFLNLLCTVFILV